MVAVRLGPNVRWIARQEAERWHFRVGTVHHICAMARPDVMFVLVKDDNGIDSIGQRRQKGEVRNGQ